MKFENPKQKTALVLGAGGFIGSHMVRRLKSEGYYVRGVDLKHPEFSKTDADKFITGDLRDQNFVWSIIDRGELDEIYQFAADMGGCQFVFTGENDAEIMHNSAQINLNVLNSLKEWEFKGKIFYSSSACIYPEELQNDYHSVGLEESDAYPAQPDSNYGWEKLFSERLYESLYRNHGINICIARLHNIFGIEGTFVGGREKAPASICRKVAEAENEITVWGDGQQTRSFLNVSECIEGIRILMKSDYKEPLNIGSDQQVKILDLWKMAIKASGKDIKINHTEMPKNFKGVNHRNSDNTLIKSVLDWAPVQPLEIGIEILYNWIQNELIAK